jgi:LuxR family maltose regulon positive regulatory protein
MAHLPAAHQGWLLKTAILDRFCAPLCEAVCQAGTECAETGLDGEEFIQWLERESLFLVPLDVRSEWFRFHHLFQQLLQDRLQKHVAPREIAAAHLRASNWFAEQGLVEEALQHALAAGEVQTAVHLVEEHRYHLMNTEQWHRLERWLKLLPEDAVAQSPLLTNTKAFLGLFCGQDQEIAIGPQEAKALMATQSLDSAMAQLVHAETAVSQGVLDIIAGRPAGALAGAQRSLELLPAQALYIRSVAVAIVGVGLQMRGDLEQGVAVIREALADPTWPAAIRARSGLYLSVAHLQEGDLSGVLRSASEFLVLAEQLQLGESRSHCRCHLGIAHYLRNELSQAEPYLLALLEDRAQSAPTYVTVGAFALVLLYHAQNRVSEAEQVIDLVRAYVETVQNTFSWAIMRAMAIELALRRGKLTEAQRMSPSVDFDLRPPSWLFYVPQLTPIKLLLAEGTRQGLKEARARLEAMDGKMRQIHRNNVRIDVLALQALVGDAQGDEVTALQKLRAALDLGSIGGNIRTFVDLGAPMAELLRRLRKQGTGKRFDQSFVRYVDLILSAFPEKTVEAAQARVSSQPEPHPPSSTLVEPLTDREYQTLRLLATDLSTEEIAAELFVTKATVYSYSKRIYSKLVAHSRFEAVQRAEALGLL